jgi:hypothetical protein
MKMYNDVILFYSTAEVIMVATMNAPIFMWGLDLILKAIIPPAFWSLNLFSDSSQELDDQTQSLARSCDELSAKNMPLPTPPMQSHKLEYIIKRKLLKFDEKPKKLGSVSKNLLELLGKDPNRIFFFKCFMMGICHK